MKNDASTIDVVNKVHMWLLLEVYYEITYELTD